MFNADETMVYNEMNTTNLEYVHIFGLFGSYDVKIPFDREVNIFIGENGLGKTTILNCIYYVFEKKFAKLENIDFSAICVKFKKDANEYRITSFDIVKYNNKMRRNHRLHYADSEIVEHFISDMLNVSDLYSSKPEEYNNRIEYITQELALRMDIPTNFARKQIYQYISGNHRYQNDEMKNGDPSKVDDLSKAITKYIDQRIIYLPTYRRIEDDLTNFNIRGDDFNKSELLIRFGMSDVQSSIDRILEKIRSEAMKGFTEMTGVLLKQYADGENVINSLNSIQCANIDVETVKIVLDRVGNEIEQRYKDKIINIINSNDIYNYKYLYLLNLIGNLILNYDLQKTYDDRIKKFSNTCNKYLKNKHFHYNQSTLTLEICLENDDKTMELTQLSSGEKQIVSLFSKLYLESNEKSIVIIDEPELSLSLKWQQMLLPDIMRTENCKLLITVTHSPFIFENEYDYDAKEIRRYIEMHRN